VLCYVTKQGPPQIRRLGDDNVGNFQVAAVQRQRKTYCSIIEQYHTDVETWGELLLLCSLSTCGFSRYVVVLATQWGILRYEAQTILQHPARLVRKPVATVEARFYRVEHAAQLVLHKVPRTCACLERLTVKVN